MMRRVPRKDGYGRLLALLAIGLAGLAGCHKPFDSGAPEMDWRNTLSYEQGRAMVGKEYVIVAPLAICSEAGAIGNPVADWKCRPRSAGRFIVQEATLSPRDNTVLRIAGPGIAGFVLYSVNIPPAFTPVENYFATGKRE
jgi:hypothetical protein